MSENFVLPLSDDENASDENTEPGPSQPKRKCRSFSMKQRLESIEYAKKNLIHAASRHFKIDRKTVKEWSRNEAKLIQFRDITTKENSRKRLAGARRHLQSKDLEEELVEWINARRAEKQRVSRRLIQQQALKLKENAGNREFKASSGWLEKFLNRHNLSNRRPTTVCQKPPSEYESILVKFVLFIGQKLRDNEYRHIYAADETAVYFDASNTNCIEKRGAKEVSVLSTGHDKVRLNVMLTARSDGFKCRPFVLLERKRPVAEIDNSFRQKLNLVWAGKSWMDDSLTEQYLRTVLGNFFYGNRILIWDAFRCHKSEATKKVLKELQIQNVIVPGGCTKFIQPADVVWNAPFKAKIRQSYEDWMLHGAKEKTKGGNPKPPPMKEYLNWIVKAWESIPREMVAKSFKACDIGNAADGSEDGLIHCFKPDASVPTGLAALQRARERNEYEFEELAGVSDNIDLEKDGENEGLSDVSLEF